MRQRTKKSIAAAIGFTVLISALAAGCYYDRDDDWGYHRYPERRYSYRYDRDHDWRYRRDYDWRYDRDYDRRYSRNNSGPFSDRYDRDSD